MHSEELMTDADASIESPKQGERRGHVRIHHGCKSLAIIPNFGFQCNSQLGSVTARSTTTLLALTSVPAAVATLTVATVATTSAAEGPPLALTLSAEHATGRSMRSLLLDVGGGDNLSGQVKPFAEVVETLGGQGVVVPLPGELGLDVAARGKGLARLDDEEVLGVEIGVLGEVEVLGSDEHALAEEVL